MTGPAIHHFEGPQRCVWAGITWQRAMWLHDDVTGRVSFVGWVITMTITGADDSALLTLGTDTGGITLVNAGLQTEYFLPKLTPAQATALPDGTHEYRITASNGTDVMGLFAGRIEKRTTV
jgi:hypothetical protein